MEALEALEGHTLHAQTLPAALREPALLAPIISCFDLKSTKLGLTSSGNPL
jgi:hypothetical protein